MGEHMRNERLLIFRSLPKLSFLIQIECILENIREIETMKMKNQTLMILFTQMKLIMFFAK